MLLHFDTDVAALVGVNAAVLFENLAFWVTENARCGRNLRDGCAWTYNTVGAFAAQFAFLSPRAIRTALGKLARAGLIRSGCYAPDPMDHTKWYTLTKEGKALYGARRNADAQKTPVDAAGASHRTGGNEKPTMNTNEKRTDEKQRPAADDEALGEVMALFSDNIHPVTGAIERDALADLLEGYGKTWTLAAIKEAAEHHGRTVRYVGAILSRWQREGFRATKKGDPHGTNLPGHPAARAAAADDNRKWDNEESGW